MTKTISFLSARCLLGASTLSLALLSGLAAVPAPCRANPVVVRNDDENPALNDLREAVTLGETADTLFMEKKWNEALTALDGAEKKFEAVERRAPGELRRTLTFKPTSMPAMRKYGYMASQDMQFPLSKLTYLHNMPLLRAETTVEDFRGALSDMRFDALILSNKAVPFKEDGVSEKDEIDIENVGRKVADFAQRLELPVPDEFWNTVVISLNRAQLRLEAVLAIKPEWKTKEMMYWGVSDKPYLSGDQALKLVQDKLAEAEMEANKANKRLAKVLPNDVKFDIDRITGDLDGMLQRINSGGFYDVGDAGLAGGYGRAAFLAQMRKNHAASYAKEGKTMPDDDLKPIEDKIAEVNATLDKKAPGLTFEPHTLAPPAISEQVKKEFQKRFPGAQVVRVGLHGSGWNIYRTEAGVITGRGREGNVMYKLPGEKWVREQLFTYIQDETGGGQYASNGRTGPGNLLRFMSGK